MYIGLRIFFGFFPIVGLAALITLRVFVQEVKPGVREAMEDTLVDTAQMPATLASDDMASGHIADGAFAGLFAILAGIMTLTRRIDGYALGAVAPRPPIHARGGGLRNRVDVRTCHDQVTIPGM